MTSPTQPTNEPTPDPVVDAQEMCVLSFTDSMVDQINKEKVEALIAHATALAADLNYERLAYSCQTKAIESLQAERDAAQARVKELKESANSLYPSKCPLTGLPFFMVIWHPENGDIPTYGGPLDSYTIPERFENEDSFYRERYDHDLGAWIEGCEIVPIKIVNADKDEILREQLTEANAKIEVYEKALKKLDEEDYEGADIAQTALTEAAKIGNNLTEPDSKESGLKDAISSPSKKLRLWLKWRYLRTLALSREFPW